jgi:hypothetical protein
MNRVDAALYRAKMDEHHFVFSHDGTRIESSADHGQDREFAELVS